MLFIFMASTVSAQQGVGDFISVDRLMQQNPQNPEQMLNLIRETIKRTENPYKVLAFVKFGLDHGIMGSARAIEEVLNFFKRQQQGLIATSSPCIYPMKELALQSNEGWHTKIPLVESKRVYFDLGNLILRALNTPSNVSHLINCAHNLMAKGLEGEAREIIESVKEAAIFYPENKWTAVKEASRYKNSAFMDIVSSILRVKLEKDDDSSSKIDLFDYVSMTKTIPEKLLEEIIAQQDVHAFLTIIDIYRRNDMSKEILDNAKKFLDKFKGEVDSSDFYNLHVCDSLNIELPVKKYDDPMFALCKRLFEVSKDTKLQVAKILLETIKNLSHTTSAIYGKYIPPIITSMMKNAEGLNYTVADGVYKTDIVGGIINISSYEKFIEMILNLFFDRADGTRAPLSCDIGDFLEGFRLCIDAADKKNYNYLLIWAHAIVKTPVPERFKRKKDEIMQSFMNQMACKKLHYTNDPLKNMSDLFFENIDQFDRPESLKEGLLEKLISNEALNHANVSKYVKEKIRSLPDRDQRDKYMEKFKNVFIASCSQAEQRGSRLLSMVGCLKELGSERLEAGIQAEIDAVEKRFAKKRTREDDHDDECRSKRQRMTKGEALKIVNLFLNGTFEAETSEEKQQEMVDSLSADCLNRTPYKQALQCFEKILNTGKYKEEVFKKVLFQYKTNDMSRERNDFLWAFIHQHFSEAEYKEKIIEKNLRNINALLQGAKASQKVEELFAVQLLSDYANDYEDVGREIHGTRSGNSYIFDFPPVNASILSAKAKFGL